MESLLEFCLNHPLLVGTFLVLLTAFFILETRRGGKSITPQQLTNLVNIDGGIVLDVREAKDYREGHITGSKNIVFAKLKDSLGELGADKEKPIVVVCKMGQHAGAARLPRRHAHLHEEAPEQAQPLRKRQLAGRRLQPPCPHGGE